MENTQPISFSKIVKRHGLVYLINSQTPYTGGVVIEHIGGATEPGIVCYYSNGKKTGKWTEYVSSIGKYDVMGHSEGNYVNGLKDGVWNSFHNNGQKACTTTYRMGQIVESSEFWSSNGEFIGSFRGDGSRDESWSFNRFQDQKQQRERAKIRKASAEWYKQMEYENSEEARNRVQENLKREQRNIATIERRTLIFDLIKLGGIIFIIYKVYEFISSGFGFLG